MSSTYLLGTSVSGRTHIVSTETGKSICFSRVAPVETSALPKKKSAITCSACDTRHGSAVAANEYRA